MAEKTLKQQAYERIRRKIIYCEYEPGTFVTENLLKDAVSGSRTPVRDAIGRLEQEKLVTIYPKKGILIAPVLPEDVFALFRFRLMWEPYVVKRYGNRLSEEWYLSFYESFFVELSIENTQHYLRDDEFHTAFIQASENPYLIRMYEQIHAHLQRSRIWVGNTDSVRLQRSKTEHQAVLLSCFKRDWDQAAEQMHEHLIRAYRSTLTELKMKEYRTDQ